MNHDIAGHERQPVAIMWRKAFGYAPLKYFGISQLTHFLDLATVNPLLHPSSNPTHVLIISRHEALRTTKDSASTGPGKIDAEGASSARFGLEGESKGRIELGIIIKFQAITI
jgi:hypothetical protein